MDIFLEKLHLFLNHFPDHNEIDTIKIIEKKSEVLSLAIELKKFDSYKYAKHNKPLILWNHRWEYDKNPELFFKSLEYVKNHGYNFDLVVLGENFSNSPEIFINAKDIFKENILHWGYAKNFDSYAKWLWKANILPVTSNQDFFGVSVMEAIYCETYPLLPNRLSFPELIPKKFHCDHFYQNDDDLIEKLINLIKTYKSRNSNALKKVALKFDWNYLAPVYDAKMNLLLK
jgi:glycosyltransferase involved in cell wall biosynthesis